MLMLCGFLLQMLDSFKNPEQNQGIAQEQMPKENKAQTCRPISTLTLFNAERQAGKLIPTF